MQEVSQQNIIKIKETLSQTRVNRFEIDCIVDAILADTDMLPALYKMTEDEDDKLSWHAWWTCEHLARSNKNLFSLLREEISSRLLETKHEGKQRLMINILLNLPVGEPIPVALLNFCLDNMLSLQKPAAIQASCMKLAHKLCQSGPELLSEFHLLLDNAETEYYTPAIRSTIRQIQHKRPDLHNRRSKLKF